ncbi:MAG TPA: TetR family transcriptional regulator [Alphaproteobacteria bacterium]|nr:TetR family transcriptional regulator [Alphaproteobacteria bacterium]
MAKTKRTAKPAKSASSTDRREHVVARALELAAERGWRHLSLGEIAEAAGLSLAELYELYPSKGAILAAFTRQIDAAALAGGVAEGESARDRLFEMLMRRFEALRPHKRAVEAILRESGADPLNALCGAMRLARSMTWMLEAAGLESRGLMGRARVNGLAMVYAATMRAWLNDDTADMSRTMAVLDRRLRRAESLVEFLRPLDRRRQREARAAAA